MTSTKQSIDFNKWGNRELWKMPDAIFLVLGREPDPALDHPNKIKAIEPDNDKELFEEIYAQVKDAMDLGQIKYSARLRTYINARFKPADFLSLLRKKGFTIPDELQSVIDDQQESMPSKRIETSARNEIWQNKANEVAKAYENKYKHKPTKQGVANRLSSVFHVDSATIERNIKKTW